MNIYLIEDEKLEFDSLRNEFLKYSYSIFPSSYENGFEEIRNYINNPSKETVIPIIEYIRKQKINLIILDIKLWGDLHAGSNIYENILLKYEETKNIPVIYLTKHFLQSEVRITRRTCYVQKIIDSDGFNIDQTFTRLEIEIEKLMKMKDGPPDWNGDNL
jgi:hypothetical protein